MEKVDSLENFPARCPLAPESKTHGQEIRHLIFGKYRILFIIEDETVFVLRVRHQAQDETMKDERKYFEETTLMGVETKSCLLKYQLGERMSGYSS